MKFQPMAMKREFYIETGMPCLRFVSEDGRNVSANTHLVERG